MHGSERRREGAGPAGPIAGSADMLSAEARGLYERLAAELGPGEALLWSAQPGVRRLKAFVGVMGCFGGALVLMGGMAIFGAVMSGQGLRSAGSAGGGQAGGLSVAYIVTGAFWALGVVLALAGLLTIVLGPAVLRRRLRRTVYAVTTTRVLELSIRWGGRVLVQEIVPTQNLNLVRLDYADGTGSLVLQPHAGGEDRAAHATLRFINIDDARGVARLIRETFGLGERSTGAPGH